jgi:hypothetical protein
MTRQVLSASIPLAFNLLDFRNSAYEKINANFAELYGHVSAGYGLPGAAAGAKGSLYRRLDGGAGTTLYVREAAGAPVVATGVLTLPANAIVNETVTIDGVTYTFRTVLAPPLANDILIGAAATNTIDNLIAAINGAGGAGTTYGTGTVAHPTVTAAAGTGDTMTLVAKTAGAAGSLIATTDMMATSNGFWATPTLINGVDDDGTGWVAK